MAGPGVEAARRRLVPVAVLIMLFVVWMLGGCSEASTSSTESARHHVCGFMKTWKRATMQPGRPDAREFAELQDAADQVGNDSLREDASDWATQLDRFARGETIRVPTTLMMDVAEDCRTLGLRFAAP